MVSGAVPSDSDAAGIDAKTLAAQVKAFETRPGVATRVVEVAGDGWLPQRWTYYMVPVADGIEMLWLVEVEETGLNSYYGVQQCFRLGGATNVEWRRKIAETPAFSEYDLWKGVEKGDATKTSLSYVVRGGQWALLPGCEESVGARTPLGVKVDSAAVIGPYQARVLAPVDTGLAARANLEKTWVCAIYWEGTSHVTVHHPADCLHAIVNIGGVPAQGKRALRGKIYWFKGTLDGLKAHWERDFPSDEASTHAVGRDSR